jgi:heat shock protein HslJ
MRVGSLAPVVIASALCLGAATSCTSGDTSTTPPLAGRAFLLQEAVGYVPVAGTVIRLSFTETDLGFDAGCNSYSGSYEIRNGTLILTTMSSTEKGCAAELQTQDEWLATFFIGRPALTLDGDTLTLASGVVVLTFLDRKVADPDRPLVGPTWSVDTLIRGNAASSVTSTLQPPTVSFDAGGVVLIGTGCNTGSGSYAATTTHLTFAGVRFTTSTCTDTASPLLLEHLATVFADGTATYGIKAARLTIERGDVGIMAVANP